MLGKDAMQEENAGIISDDRQTSKECDTADCILSYNQAYCTLYLQC